MSDQKKEFTRLGVTLSTHKKISILAPVLDDTMAGLVERWADEAWQKAKKDGLVTDVMIQSANKPSPTEKKTIARAVNAQPALVA